MNIVITQWALDAYLDLKHGKVFCPVVFQDKIRPDVMLLKYYPQADKFSNGKFWSSATDGRGSTITGGFKMKWHQVGNGKVQLRLPVAFVKDACPCSAYVKKDEKMDRRMMAKFKVHIQLIKQQQYTQCGVL